MNQKIKVSISLASELLDEVDREAERRASSRSRIIEMWLHLAARRRAAQELEKQTIEYYQARSAAQQEEDEEWGHLSATAAQTLTIDEDRPPAPKARRAG